MITRKLFLRGCLARSRHFSDFVAQSLDNKGKTEWDDILIPSLVTFQSLFTHLLVPQKFVVPSNDEKWPVYTWNFPLGNRVNAIRLSRKNKTLTDSKFQQLQQLEFVWDAREWKFQFFFLRCLSVYKTVYGDVSSIPMKFVVPSNDHKWPTYAFGYKLGNHVNSVRNGQCQALCEKFANELDGIGFTWKPKLINWQERVMPGLTTFYRIYGHADVPQKFIIPHNDLKRWPDPKLWGLKLGIAVKNIRTGQYAQHVKENCSTFEEMGFVWNDHLRADMKIQREIIPLIQQYYSTMKNRLISKNFVIPPGDSRWPKKSWGLALGNWVYRIRSHKLYLSERTLSNLNDIDFIWNHHDHRFYTVLLPALQKYKELNGTCKKMSYYFRVPRNDSNWPELSQGIYLGGAVWHIRYTNTWVHDKQKRIVLKQLGVL